jgi:hypothetical protein
VLQRLEQLHGGARAPVCAARGVRRRTRAAGTQAPYPASSCEVARHVRCCDAHKAGRVCCVCVLRMWVGGPLQARRQQQRTCQHPASSCVRWVQMGRCCSTQAWR